jgi:hypothetical protein
MTKFTCNNTGEVFDTEEDPADINTEVAKAKEHFGHSNFFMSGLTDDTPVSYKKTDLNISLPEEPAPE